MPHEEREVDLRVQQGPFMGFFLLSFFEVCSKEMSIHGIVTWLDMVLMQFKY